MKSLATCKPTELRQTNRIRKAVKRWLDVTDILSIRGTKAKLIPFRNDMSDEERAETFAENRRLVQEQAREHSLRIFEEILEKHPDETLVVLALCCFVEPEDVDKHTVDEYLAAFTELLNNKAVVDFFTSLMQLDQRSILTASKQ